MRNPLEITLRPQGDRIREDDAIDFAHEVVALARMTGAQVVVGLFPDRSVGLRLARLGDAAEVDAASFALCFSLVGVYTADASEDDIRDDLLAMPIDRDLHP